MLYIHWILGYIIYYILVQQKEAQIGVSAFSFTKL